MDLYVKVKGKKEKYLGVLENLYDRNELIEKLKGTKEDCIAIIKQDNEEVFRYFVDRQFRKDCANFYKSHGWEDKLYKQFTYKKLSLSRADFEYMPDAMVAFNWSDNKMKTLLKRVYEDLFQSCGNLMEMEEEDYLSDFWVAAESIAVKMGMTYYEDYLSKEELKRL